MSLKGAFLGPAPVLSPQGDGMCVGGWWPLSQGRGGVGWVCSPPAQLCQGDFTLVWGKQCPNWAKVLKSLKEIVYESVNDWGDRNHVYKYHPEKPHCPGMASAPQGPFRAQEKACGASLDSLGSSFFIHRKSRKSKTNPQNQSGWNI